MSLPIANPASCAGSAVEILRRKEVLPLPRADLTPMSVVVSSLACADIASSSSTVDPGPMKVEVVAAYRKDDGHNACDVCANLAPDFSSQPVIRSSAGTDMNHQPRLNFDSEAYAPPPHE